MEDSPFEELAESFGGFAALSAHRGRQSVLDRRPVGIGDLENHRIAMGPVFGVDLAKHLDPHGFGELRPERDELLGHEGVDIGLPAGADRALKKGETFERVEETLLAGKGRRRGVSRRREAAYFTPQIFLYWSR